MKKLYDVYFLPTQPMVICVEAESEEEARRIIEEDDGELLDNKEAMNRFCSALEWNEEWNVVDVEEVDEDEYEDEYDYEAEEETDEIQPAAGYVSLKKEKVVCFLKSIPH